jgi:hypothetical protein
VTTTEDNLQIAEKVAESLPAIALLAGAIVKLVAAKNPQEELDALQSAAEAVKARMDALKFPNEPTV